MVILNFALKLASIIILFFSQISHSKSAAPLHLSSQPSSPCTRIGCENGVHIDFQSDYKWKPGFYKFEITMDQNKTICQGNLPLKKCNEPTLRCTGSGIAITESGCALPASAQGFGSILISSTPQKIKVRVLHKDVPLVEYEGQVQYQTLQPNGPQCGPHCRQSIVQLKLR